MRVRIRLRPSIIFGIKYSSSNILLNLLRNLICDSVLKCSIRLEIALQSTTTLYDSALYSIFLKSRYKPWSRRGAGAAGV